jgi:predicted transcriptional regulator YheO
MSENLVLPKWNSKGDAAKKPVTFALLRQVVLILERLFAPHWEIVVHGFTDLERSIIGMRDSLSGRSIGGPATDLLLAPATPSRISTARSPSFPTAAS